jgi:tetratricopeptide (TPR) repeat protein
MKRWILVVVAVGATIGLGLHVKRPTTKDLAAAETVAEAEPEAEIRAPVQEVSEPKLDMDEKQVSRKLTAAVAPRSEPITRAVADIGQVQNIDTLVSPYATFEEKQAVWKRLKETGKLDQAIGELEQRLAGNPQAPEVSAALGQAYMKKCAQIQDVREQALLAMKADQTLEAALNLDPSNWEARFTKTVGMSYWPAELNKGKEVIQEFSKLIEQQESQAPQPHFARSYAWLGEQYRKAGYSDYAAQVWQRGAALFPSDAELRAKLAAQP